MGLCLKDDITVIEIPETEDSAENRNRNQDLPAEINRSVPR